MWMRTFFFTTVQLISYYSTLIFPINLRIQCLIYWNPGPDNPLSGRGSPWPPTLSVWGTGIPAGFGNACPVKSAPDLISDNNSVGYLVLSNIECSLIVHVQQNLLPFMQTSCIIVVQRKKLALQIVEQQFSHTKMQSHITSFPSFWTYPVNYLTL